MLIWEGTDQRSLRGGPRSPGRQSPPLASLQAHRRRGAGGRLTAEGRGLVTVVQAVVVPVALPALLDAAAVGTGKLARLALGWGHVGWVCCGHHRGVRGKVRPRSRVRC